MQIKKKQTIAIITGIFLVIIAALFLQGTGLIIGKKDNQNATDLEIGLWTPETIVEQTFVASMDHLQQIDFWVDSYHPWDSPYLECRLFEIETERNPYELPYEFLNTHKKEIRAKQLNGWLISGHMFNSFSFPPIPESKGKPYLLSIRSPAIKHGGSSILLASLIDRYLYFGNLFIDGEREDGDLAFRLLYNKPRIELLRSSIHRIALEKPIFFSKPVVYYMLYIIYFVLLGIFLYKIVVWRC